MMRSLHTMGCVTWTSKPNRLATRDRWPRLIASEAHCCFAAVPAPGAGILTFWGRKSSSSFSPANPISALCRLKNTLPSTCTWLPHANLWKKWGTHWGSSRTITSWNRAPVCWQISSTLYTGESRADSGESAAWLHSGRYELRTK